MCYGGGVVLQFSIVNSIKQMLQHALGVSTAPNTPAQVHGSSLGGAVCLLAAAGAGLNDPRPCWTSHRSQHCA